METRENIGLGRQGILVISVVGYLKLYTVTLGRTLIFVVTYI